ncbi:hypothetical protein BO86DRAFT_202244 [Aspergillus japonicus CBS 114.51]|uniref:Uncharacterized protein n=1 Tax=Aspergillus japonicus CBS 114.51 TaxID=1448312 RepID=A0A8T8WQ36_ASPJA|nr:hypothetical protein BO86DRAFT_202244 [Aspergillus japonicus CBS 114.51]RAH77926.1 hypothetical protein BO86DRAFT_202244 [Aspergillus japonicus CBS 114.51]
MASRAEGEERKKRGKREEEEKRGEMKREGRKARRAAGGACRVFFLWPISNLGCAFFFFFLYCWFLRRFARPLVL